MKRAGQIALLLIAICLLAVPVMAATTTPTVQIPQNVTAYVTIEGQGAVYLGDTLCEISGAVVIPRSQLITFKAVPDSEWTLQSVVLNGEDQIERFRAGAVMRENVTEDITLYVVFQKAASTPETGDSGVAIGGILLVISAASLLFFVGKQRNLSQTA